jgi:hypothetical protein
MSDDSRGTFLVKSWNERLTQDFKGGTTFSYALVTQVYDGVITGEGSVEYVIFLGGGQRIFVGFERVVGTVGGRSGSFVVRHSGHFENGLAKSEWVVVPNTGTDGLAGIGGAGSFVAEHSGQGVVTFHPSFS